MGALGAFWNVAPVKGTAWRAPRKPRAEKPGSAGSGADGAGGAGGPGGRQLVANPRNPRLHPEAQLADLAASLRRFGQPRPLIARAARTC